jgi:selenide, water dikinase
VDESPGPRDDAALVVTDPSATTALVMTIDVVTAMVDDARTFGAIAAANSVSDVYAMGGLPTVALSFIGFPSDKLPIEVLGEIAAGLRDTADRAATAIVGGHTIVDPEPKAGLSVTGIVERNSAWSHRHARPGQILVLTKAIGTGIAIQAMKGLKCPAALQKLAIDSMLALNRAARDAGVAAGATSATDITGFGLLGHLGNICEASGVTANLTAHDVPVFEGARALAQAGVVPGGSKRNLKNMEPRVRFDPAVDDVTRLLLADAQTSGGLLLCVPEENTKALIARLEGEGSVAAVIGDLLGRADGPLITVAP